MFVFEVLVLVVANIGLVLTAFVVVIVFVVVVIVRVVVIALMFLAVLVDMFNWLMWVFDLGCFFCFNMWPIFLLLAFALCLCLGLLLRFFAASSVPLFSVLAVWPGFSVVFLIERCKENWGALCAKQDIN